MLNAISDQETPRDKQADRISAGLSQLFALLGPKLGNEVDCLAGNWRQIELKIVECIAYLKMAWIEDVTVEFGLFELWDV